MNEPESIVEIFLQPGEFYFGDCDTRIRTILGSCVSITMWHPQRRIGGMCHYMLASNNRSKVTKLDGKYGEDAVMMFLEEAIRHGTDPNEYQFKIFGGGHMFRSPKETGPCRDRPCEEVLLMCQNVSCRNANIGRALLKHYGLNVVAEHLGGHGHRNVIFDIWSGAAWVRQTPMLNAVAKSA